MRNKARLWPGFGSAWPGIFVREANQVLKFLVFVLQSDPLNLQSEDRLKNATKVFKLNPLQGVVAQWCNPLTLKPEQSGGMGLRLGRASTLQRHDKWWQT